MALYNHVANKEALLDGMVDVVWSEINDATTGIHGEWKEAMRRSILAAREVLLRHRWAPGVLESRTNDSAPMSRYYNSLIGLFLAGGFSYDLTHHALHALGTRALGYTHEPWDDSQEIPDPSLVARQMAGEYPNIAAMLEGVTHDTDTTLGWCDGPVRVRVRRRPPPRRPRAAPRCRVERRRDTVVAVSFIPRAHRLAERSTVRPRR